MTDQVYTTFVLSHICAIWFRNSSKHVLRKLIKGIALPHSFNSCISVVWYAVKAGGFLRLELYLTKYISTYFSTANHICCNSALEKLFPVILRLQIHHNHCQW